MNTIDENFVIMSVGFLLAATLQMYLLRRKINNIADPLLFFALTSAFTLGLGLHAVDSVDLYVRIVFYFCCFYTGLFFALRKTTIVNKPLVMRSHMRHFKLIIVIGSAIYLISNLIFWANFGVVILSDDPSLYKSTAYSGGFGFVRRINWGFGVFILIGATYWYLWERSKTALLCLGLGVIISISGGSKSSLIPIFFSLGLYFLNPFLPVSRFNNLPNRRLLLHVVLLALVPVTTVLLIEQGSLDMAFFALIQRLFYFGDILLYWGQPELRAHFSNLGMLDYLRDSFGSILGMLRLIEYGSPMGNQFVQFTLPVGSDYSDSLGPNLPFYVRGELYLGTWFAPVHALAVGWIYGKIRRAFICYRASNLLHYTLAAFAVYVSGALPGEEGLAIGQVVDFLMIYIFVHFAASIINASLMSSKSEVNLISRQTAPPRKIAPDILPI